MLKKIYQYKKIYSSKAAGYRAQIFSFGWQLVCFSYLSKMSNQSISKIVYEVCDTLIEDFKDEIQLNNT